MGRLHVRTCWGHADSACPLMKPALVQEEHLEAVRLHAPIIMLSKAYGSVRPEARFQGVSEAPKLAFGSGCRLVSYRASASRIGLLAVPNEPGASAGRRRRTTSQSRSRAPLPACAHSRSELSEPSALTRPQPTAPTSTILGKLYLALLPGDLYLLLLAFQ